MSSGDSKDSKVDVNFESHPPINDDLDGVATLLRQTLLHYVDCNALARHLIDLKEVTQVIALEAPEDQEAKAEEEEQDDDEDEPDNDIYGVTSLIDLPIDNRTQTDDKSSQIDARKNLLKFLLDKCPDIKKTIETSGKECRVKVGVVINERFINLPPQLSVPTLKDLTIYLDRELFTHLVFVSKVQLRSRSTETKLPSKKTKSGSSKQINIDPIIFVNAEEEIIFENSEYHSDVDVSSFCDENATWSQSSDVKYIPHRRIMVVDKKKWPTILQKLEEELAV